MTNESGEKKPTVRRRRRAGKGGKGGVPRILWLAVLVCVAGAVALFRTSGGGSHAPAGLGENSTVVTAPDVGGAPASGDVEIADQGLKLTPEAPVAGGDLGHADNAPLEVMVNKPFLESGKVDSTAALATTGTTQKTEETADPPKQADPDQAKPGPARAAPRTPAPRLVPQPQGPYLVQAGSFGDDENAQKAADRLKKAGWNANVHVANKAGGGLVFRVQIGYFASREDAQAFIDQNGRYLSGAIPAHR